MAQETGVFLPQGSMGLVDRGSPWEAEAGGSDGLRYGPTYFVKVRNSYPDPPSSVTAAIASSLGVEAGGQEGRGVWVPILVITELALDRASKRGVFEGVCRLRVSQRISPAAERALMRLRDAEGQEPPTYWLQGGPPSPQPEQGAGSATMSSTALQQALGEDPGGARSMPINALLGTRGPRLPLGDDGFVFANGEALERYDARERARHVQDDHGVGGSSAAASSSTEMGSEADAAEADDFVLSPDDVVAVRRFAEHTRARMHQEQDAVASRTMRPGCKLILSVLGCLLTLLLGDTWHWVPGA